MHSQAIVYSKSAESTEVLNRLTDESGLTILPVSAESAGLLPDKKGAKCLITNFIVANLFHVILS